MLSTTLKKLGERSIGGVTGHTAYPGRQSEHLKEMFQPSGRGLDEW